MATKRVLFLGRKLGIDGVKSYDWAKVPAGIQLVDYDIVIFDFTPGDEDSPLQVARFPARIDLARLVLGSSATVIAVGRPERALMSNTPDVAPPRLARGWLPLFPKTYPTAGVRCYLGDGTPFRDYLQRHVNRYTWVVQRGDDRLGEFSAYCDVYGVQLGAADIRSKYTALATTNGQEPIGLHLGYRLLVKNGTAPPARGAVYWLPSPDDPADPETWVTLLADAGFSANTPMPKWASTAEWLTPHQVDLLAQVATKQADLEAAAAVLTSKREELQTALAFQHLLFERGTPLEQIVRATLEILGGTVVVPEDPGVEDAYVTAPDGRRAGVEIKGRDGVMKSTDIDQATRWKGKGLDEDPDSEWKGLLIGNPHRRVAPDDRDAPVQGVGPAKEMKRAGVALVTTVQLHKHLCDFQAGAFDKEKFWAAVMDGVGEIDFDDADAAAPDAVPDSNLDSANGAAQDPAGASIAPEAPES